MKQWKAGQLVSLIIKWGFKAQVLEGSSRRVNNI